MTTHPTEIKRRSVSSASALIAKRFNKTNMPSTSDTPPPETPKVHVRIVPSIDDPNRCIIFDIVDRELEAGAVIKIGRYSDRHANTPNYMSFKSKVVSRCHCEIVIEEDGKVN